MTKSELPVAVLRLTRREAVRQARKARDKGQNAVPVWPSPMMQRFVALSMLGAGPVFSSVDTPIYVGLPKSLADQMTELLAQCIKMCRP
jgi:hypothetical protein